MSAPITALHPLPINDYLHVLGPDDVRVKGHRIGLEHIVHKYHEGYSPEQIAMDFPGVELKAIYVIIAYYLHYQGEVDAYIARLDAQFEADYREWEASPPSAASLRVRELKAQRIRERQL